MTPIHLRNTPETHGGSLETYPHYIIISHLVEWVKPVNYLEIGVRHSPVYNAVKNKVNTAYLVDIKFLDMEYTDNTLKFEMTSDMFFNILNKSIRFDFVFIDGGHSSEQVFTDFTNVKDLVSHDGFVVLHDTYPCDERMTDPIFSHNAWEAALRIKQTFSHEWEMITLPFNPGLTIMKRMDSNRQMLWK